MPSYRFSWDNFDDASVSLLSATLGGPTPIGGARPWLAERVKRPNRDFVRATKNTLARGWLRKQPGIAKAVYEALHSIGIGPLGPPRVGEACARYVEECKNTKTVQQLLCEALIRFGDVDRTATDEDLDLGGVRRFASISPGKQGADPRTPHSHQNEAWERLDAHLAESEGSGVFQGMLVMPTGSGKTYTTAHWLMRSVVSRGGRVLWLAHRQELLNQAARELTALACLATGRERLRVRVVSGVHCRAHQIDPADDIIVSSVASLARGPEIAKQLVSDPKLFLVVDEAHHAPAKSYRDIIEALLKQARPRILGITATPTRTAMEERPVLAKLFGKRTIHQVEPRTLIERGILARPAPVRVRTGVTADAGATPEDLKHITQFNELSAEMLDRIGQMTERNELIVRTYLDNRSKFGKTLVFAVNVTHAAHLAQRLKDEGVAADYVASWLPDGTPRDNQALIERFRKKSAGDAKGMEPEGSDALDVLVNVEIMTEGVDVPAVRTVFLARPTQSEILLRQMIGRALRGPAAGGNETAYLVSFEDHWEQFDDWDQLLNLVQDVVPPPPDGPAPPPDGPAPPPPAPPEPEGISWEQIREVARALRHQHANTPIDAFESVPHGLYVLEHEVDGEDVRLLVNVYEHQQECWNELLATLDEHDPEELAALQPGHLSDDFFFDCEPVRPTVNDVARVLDHYRARGGRPEYVPLAQRAACDPRALAQTIRDEDMGEKRRIELVTAAYTTLARAVYPTLLEFRAAVDAAVRNDGPIAPLGRPVFDPPPEMQLAKGPAHDLNALLRETLARGQELLGHELPGQISILWSRRIIKGWYAKAFYRLETKNGDGEIRVNRLLDSPDISTETIRYLLWHEYLHLFLKAGHTQDFRKKERRWPKWVDHDRDLDTLNERFGIQYW